MTKINVQIYNTRFDLEFGYREDLDDFIRNLRSCDTLSYSENRNKIADALEKEAHLTNSREDLKLIPEIIKAINTHVKNVGDLNKFGSKKLTGWIAHTLTYDKEKDQWVTDNGYVLTYTLRYNLKWFLETAPEYWYRKQ